MKGPRNHASSTPSVGQRNRAASNSSAAPGRQRATWMGDPGADSLDERQLMALLKTKPALVRHWLPPKVVYGPGGKRRERGRWERLHLLVSEPTESKTGSIITLSVLVVILVSCANFVVQTVPEVLQYSEGCEDCKPLVGAARNNNTLAEERAKLGDACRECEPTPTPVLLLVEAVCIGVFTVEYLVRLCTAHATRTRQERNTGFDFEFPGMKGLRRTWLFVVDPMNLVDLVAIAPFFLQLAFPSMDAKLSIIRLIRLFRIFLIPELGNLGDRLSILLTMMRSLLVYFTVFLIFSGFGVVIFASLVFFVEQGSWDSATGEFQRPAGYYLAADEPSPFVSIPMTFWWVVVSITTVGYGDMVPHTSAGRVIGSVTLYCGIFLMSLPITVMGISLADFYLLEISKVEREKRVKALNVRAMRLFVMGARLRSIAKAWCLWTAFVRELKESEANIRGVLRSELQVVPVLVARRVLGLPASSSHQLALKRAVQTDKVVAAARAVRTQALVQYVRECVREQSLQMFAEVMKEWREGLDAVVADVHRANTVQVPEQSHVAAQDSALSPLPQELELAVFNRD